MKEGKGGGERGRFVTLHQDPLQTRIVRVDRIYPDIHLYIADVAAEGNDAILEQIWSVLDRRLPQLLLMTSFARDQFVPF